MCPDVFSLHHMHLNLTQTSILYLSICLCVQLTAYSRKPVDILLDENKVRRELLLLSTLLFLSFPPSFLLSFSLGNHRRTHHTSYAHINYIHPLHIPNLNLPLYTYTYPYHSAPPLTPHTHIPPPAGGSLADILLLLAPCRGCEI